MQVFKAFFKIAKKQLPQIMVYAGIIGILLYALTLTGSGSNGYEDIEKKVVIFNNDDSAKAKYLEQYLGELHDVKEVVDDKEVLQDYLYYRVVDYVLYIDEGFELSNVKRAGTASCIYIDNHIASFCKNYDAYILAGYSEEEAYEKTVSAMDTAGLVSLKGEQGSKPMIYYFYTYLTYVLLSLLIIVLAPVIIALNRKEVKERTLISSFKDSKRTFQIFLAALIFAVVTWLCTNLIGVAMCNSQYTDGKNLYYLLNSAVFLLVSAGVVCMISSLEVKGEAISMMSNVFGLAFSFLGGVFVPLEIFGEGMLAVAKFVPTYWYVKCCDNISNGVINGETYMYMGVQLLFALAFFAVALVITKRRRISRG